MFTPTDINWTTDPYKRIDYPNYMGGTVVFNQRTAAMMEVVQHRLGRRFDAIPQGSYHDGDQSAGTHNGGGAGDIFDRELILIRHIMRAVGFAAFHRPKIVDVWDEHDHAIALGDREASDPAKAQWHDYKWYLDGLEGHNPDNTWHPFPKGGPLGPYFNYAKWLGARDVDFNDKVPGRNATVGQTLRDMLDMADALKEFRRNEFDRDVATKKALADILAAVQQP